MATGVLILMSNYQFANNPATTLSGPITAGATSISVTSAADFPAQGKFTIIVDSEIMLVTGVSGTTFTVERGAEETTAATHTNNSAVTAILTKGSFLDAHHVDARNYGATGDGSTNDTTSLKAALAAAVGGIVYVPVGTFVVDDSLTIPANTILRGAGEATVLSFTSSAAEACLLPSSGSGVESLYVKDARATPPAATVGINLNSVNNVSIRGVRISGFLGNGISASGSANCVIADCRVHDIGDSASIDGDGILLSVCEMFRIIGCDVQSSGKHGINLAGTSTSDTTRDVTVVGCVCNDNGDSGINVQLADRITMTGNVCDSNGINGGSTGGQGIQIADNCTDILVASNATTNSTEQGIVVQNACNRVTLQGNTCSGNTWSGIKVSDGSTNVTVASNICIGNDLKGVLVDGSTTACDGVTVVGNTCRSNGEDGICWTSSSNGTVSANLCIDNNTSNNSKSGIVLDGTSSDVAVTGNVCISSGTPAQNYGIRPFSGDHYAVVGNTARGNTNQIRATIESGGTNYTKSGNLET